MSILAILDNQINGFYQNNNDYPKLILMSKETKDKVFNELLLESDTKDSWVDKKDNYRGIEIKVKKDTFLELIGE